MNNISTQQLILGSGLLTTTGSILYLNQSIINGAIQSGITGSINITQSFTLQPILSSGSIILANNPFYINTGNAPITWTMPSITSNKGINYQLKNKGSGIVTLTGATPTDMFFTNLRSPSFQISIGQSYQLCNDSIDWNIM